jgi:predicted DNA-binding transcriptional regulator AlpA
MLSSSTSPVTADNFPRTREQPTLAGVHKPDRYTTEQVLAITGWTPALFEKQRRARGFPPQIGKGGKNPTWWASTVDAWLDRHWLETMSKEDHKLIELLPDIYKLIYGKMTPIFDEGASDLYRPSDTLIESYLASDFARYGTRYLALAKSKLKLTQCSASSRGELLHCASALHQEDRWGAIEGALLAKIRDLMRARLHRRAHVATMAVLRLVMLAESVPPYTPDEGIARPGCPCEVTHMPNEVCSCLLQVRKNAACPLRFPRSKAAVTASGNSEQQAHCELVLG